MTNTPLPVFASLLASLFAFLACGKESVPAGPDESKSMVLHVDAEKLKRTGVEVNPAGGGELVRSRPLLGNLVPNEHNIAKVAAGVGGIVRELPVKVGDLVKAGDPLAVVESREAADVAFLYLEQQQRASFAKQAYEREKSLVEKKLGTQENLRAAQSELRKSYLDVQLTTQKLRLLSLLDADNRLVSSPSRISSFTLRSPIDATVTTRHAVRGEHAPAERELFTLMNLSSVWLEVKAPQTAARQVHVGQEVQVVNDQLGLKTRSVVIFVSPLADPATRTVLVRLLLANQDGQWRPGSCATAEFVDERKTVPVRLPREAVVSIDDESSVFAETGPGVFRVRRVVTGLETRDEVEIVQGLDPGDRVVTRHALFLKAQWISSED